MYIYVCVLKVSKILLSSNKPYILHGINLEKSHLCSLPQHTWTQLPCAHFKSKFIAVRNIWTHFRLSVPPTPVVLRFLHVNIKFEINSNIVILRIKKWNLG